MNKKKILFCLLGLSLISFLMTVYTSFIFDNIFFSFRNFIFFIVTWVFLVVVFLIIFYFIEKRVEEKRKLSDITPFSIKYFTTLASGFAHEINNPLTGILGSVELLELKNDYSKEYLNKKLSLINQLGYRIREIIDEIDLMSPKQCCTKVELNIISVLRKLIEEYRDKYKDVEVDFTNRGDDFVSVFANIFNIEKLFFNIMENSMESLFENGLKDKKIKIEVCAPNKDFLKIKFIDNGKGFSDIERVFMPFFSTKNNSKNRGLGLTLSYVQVLEHGGTIELNNLENNAGAEVLVTLPVIYPDKKKKKKLFKGDN